MFRKWGHRDAPPPTVLVVIIMVLLFSFSLFGIFKIQGYYLVLPWLTWEHAVEFWIQFYKVVQTSKEVQELVGRSRALRIWWCWWMYLLIVSFAASYECRMNEQWSCVGICVEPQSEQRSLGTNQQAATVTRNLSVTDRTTSAASLPAATTPTDYLTCSPSSSSQLVDCAAGTNTGSSTNSFFDTRTSVSCPISFNKGRLHFHYL